MKHTKYSPSQVTLSGFRVQRGGELQASLAFRGDDGEPVGGVLRRRAGHSASPKREVFLLEAVVLHYAGNFHGSFCGFWR